LVYTAVASPGASQSRRNLNATIRKLMPTKATPVRLPCSASATTDHNNVSTRHMVATTSGVPHEQQLQSGSNHRGASVNKRQTVQMPSQPATVRPLRTSPAQSSTYHHYKEAPGRFGKGKWACYSDTADHEYFVYEPQANFGRVQSGRPAYCRKYERRGYHPASFRFRTPCEPRWHDPPLPTHGLKMQARRWTHHGPDALRRSTRYGGDWLDCLRR
jgi:hypothetical protein